VEQLSGGALNWTDGMLYPLLHRLEQQGLLAARWRVADSGRKRKYYALTEQGMNSLREQRHQWQLITQTLNRVWDDAQQVQGIDGHGQFA
jgi:PadR family transcriptional regulator PadR